MDHRHAKILLKHFDDIEGAPGGPQHVDRLGARLRQEFALDEAVDLETGKLLSLVEIDIHAGHGKTVEAGVVEIVGIDAIDVAAEISGADETAHLERAQCVDMAGAGREDARFVFVLPGADQRLLFVVAEHHEWRRARRIDDIAPGSGKLGDFFLVSGDHGLEFVDSASPHIEDQRNDADPIW